MVKYLLLVLMILGFVACKTTSYTYKYKSLPPEVEIQDSSKRIVLINAELLPEFVIAVANNTDAPANVAKSNYVTNLSKAFEEDLKLSTNVVNNLNKEDVQQLLSKNKLVADKIMREYNASVVIVIKKEQGGFKLNKVEKIKYTNGKVAKTALFDVFFQTSALIIQDNSFTEKEIYVSKYHSERTILGGTPVKSPKEKNYREDILSMSKENSKKFVHLFMDKQVIETFKNDKRYFIEVQ